MEMANQEKLAAYRHEMRTRGLPLHPPDVNASGVRFSVEDGPGGRGVRYALPALKGLGVAVAEAVVRERESGGPYRDLFDFAARLGPKVVNRRILEVLVKAGAFDSLEPNRRRLFEAVEAALRHAQAAERAREEGQVGLFGEALLPEPPALPEVEDWPHFERLQQELSVVGFYLSAHPLESLLPDLERAGVLPAARLFEEPGRLSGRKVRLAGVVVGKQERAGRNGRFAFVQLSDPTSQFEVAVFSDLLARTRELLEARDPLVVEAEVRTDGEELRLTAECIEPLERIVALAAGDLPLEVEVDGPEALERLRALVEPAESARGGLRLVLLLRTGPGERVVMELPKDLVVPAVRRADLERLPDVRVRKPAA
ncbi:DNA polymerase III subunit alpha [bacterium HR39]|nr:DNA polymerase III subunit alpha [bacterium HR39]